MSIHHAVQLLQQVRQLSLLAACHRTTFGSKVQQRLTNGPPPDGDAGKGVGVGARGGADDAVEDAFARHGDDDDDDEGEKKGC
jgi:hypothetical protein